jgi:uncharacterized protein YabN with tetrapyrrole methylase and pyrophosphatase domain
MTDRSQFPYDIVIVGLGITGTQQVTYEVQETLKRCPKTFVADEAPGVVSFVQGWCPEVVDLSNHFQPSVHRARSYRAIAGDVVAAALTQAPVCFATYGHPTVYSYPTILIKRAALLLDLRVQTLAGVSFLDTLFIDLGIDPGFDGLQMYEATDLLVRRRPLQNDVGCVISQATVVADPREGAIAPKANLGLLQRYLLGFYPPQHEVVIAVSAIHPLAPPIASRVPLSSLADALAGFPHNATLYISPVRRRPIADPELAAAMRPLPD